MTLIITYVNFEVILNPFSRKKHWKEKNRRVKNNFSQFETINSRNKASNNNDTIITGFRVNRRPTSVKLFVSKYFFTRNTLCSLVKFPPAIVKTSLLFCFHLCDVYVSFWRRLIPRGLVTYYLKNSVIMGHLKTALFLIMDYFLLKRTGKLMTLLYNEI